MAQEHVDEAEKAIEQLLELRRMKIAAISKGGYAGGIRAEVVEIQQTIDAIKSALIDETDRLPSIYETQGIRSI